MTFDCTWRGIITPYTLFPLSLLLSVPTALFVRSNNTYPYADLHTDLIASKQT